MGFRRGVYWGFGVGGHFVRIDEFDRLTVIFSQNYSKQVRIGVLIGDRAPPTLFYLKFVIFF